MPSNFEEDSPIQDLKYHLLGTCLFVAEAVEQLDLDPDIDWEDEMLTAGIETCLGCGWWHEVGELIDEDPDNQPGYCEDCRYE